MLYGTFGALLSASVSVSLIVHVVLLRVQRRPINPVIVLHTATSSAMFATGARQGGGDFGQATTKVGADVVINERIGARVAVGETVTEHAEDGIDAVLRLQPEVGDQEVGVHWQPAGAEHDDDRQEDPPRVGRSARLTAL